MGRKPRARGSAHESGAVGDDAAGAAGGDEEQGEERDAAAGRTGVMSQDAYSADPSLSIELILPHRGAMVLLDGARRKGDDAVEAWWTVSASSPWLEDGRLVRAVFVEIAAQAAAAHVGLVRLAAGLPISSGRLGAADALRILGDARAGDRIDCEVSFTLRYENLVRAEFRLYCGGTLLADGQLTLAVGA